MFDVDGALFNVTLDGGRASVGLTNLTEGNHSVVVVYSGDDYYYNASGSKSFAPKSLVSSINVTVSDIVYGDVLVEED